MYAGLLQVGLRGAKETEGCPTSTLVFTDKSTALKRGSVLMAKLTVAVGDFMGCFEPELMSKALGEPGRQRV
jgi:hypothetical protein